MNIGLHNTEHIELLCDNEMKSKSCTPGGNRRVTKETKILSFIQKNGKTGLPV